mmetsp:Transcript_17004/g.52494  ORF Transcript_17004/g.52494 Transcript_17004/m.52494 type:complete len:247 (-) Transcript_17004:49-789(-)
MHSTSCTRPPPSMRASASSWTSWSPSPHSPSSTALCAICSRSCRMPPTRRCSTITAWVGVCTASSRRPTRRTRVTGMMTTTSPSGRWVLSRTCLPCQLAPVPRVPRQCVATIKQAQPVQLTMPQQLPHLTNIEHPGPSRRKRHQCSTLPGLAPRSLLRLAQKPKQPRRCPRRRCRRQHTHHHRRHPALRRCPTLSKGRLYLQGVLLESRTGRRARTWPPHWGPRSSQSAGPGCGNTLRGPAALPVN